LPCIVPLIWQRHRYTIETGGQRTPTSVWTGSLSLGMVVVPVRLYPAIRKKTVRFHELDRGGRRVRHVRVTELDVDWEWTVPHPDPPPTEGEKDTYRDSPLPVGGKDTYPDPPPGGGRDPAEVAFEEIRKGYEVAPGQYVSMTREEVAALAPERSRVIDVEQFVDVSAVDPIYFESRYYMVPDRDSSAPFRILRQAMDAAGRMAIAWFTLRSRRHLCAVRPFGNVMLLTTMVHADEIVQAEFWIPDANSEPTDKELTMARLLIDTLSGPFEADRYPDEHRDRLMEAIEARTPSGPSATTPPPPTRVLDLMAALEASVKAAKAVRAEQDRPEKAKRRRPTGT
jgi:DNA end-binding protein Ku